MRRLLPRRKKIISLMTMVPGIASVLFIAFPAVASPAGVSAFGDLNIIKARDALDAGNPNRALYYLEAGLKARPRGPVADEARFQAARAALAAGRNEAALTYLEGLEDRLSDIADYVHALRARAYRAQGLWNDAADAWRTLITDHARSPLTLEAHYGVADAHYAQGNRSAAEKAYALALRLAPRDEGAMIARFNLGRLAESRRGWQTAAEKYREIAYRYPSHPLRTVAERRLSALVEAGHVAAPSFYEELDRVDRLLARRSLEEVERHLEILAPQAVNRTRRQALAYRQAQLAYRQRAFDRAITLFKELAETTTSRYRRLDYERWVARTYSAADEQEAAVGVYLEIAENYAGTRSAKDARFMAAWLAYNGRDYGRAIHLFKAFVEHHPRDRSTVDALWYLGWSNYRMGELTQAWDVFRALRQRFSRTSLAQRAWYWEGRVAAALGALQEAKDAYQATVDRSPLNYYGLLARQRLHDLEQDVTPVRIRKAPLVLASLEPGGLAIIEPEDTPAIRRPSRLGDVPWGKNVFAWNTEAGARLMQLMRLGLDHRAAELVDELPVKRGSSNDDVAYARARLLFSLGDFHQAFRIVQTTFHDDLDTVPDETTLPYFMLTYPHAFEDTVRAVASEMGVSPWLLLGLMRQESAFNDRARSWASARGLMQIIPRTAAQIAQALEVDDYNYGVLTDPRVNIRFGAWYMAQLLRKYQGNPVLAVGSYNAGPQAVSRWVNLGAGSTADEFIEEIPYRETRAYVKKVMSNVVIYNVLYGDGSVRLPATIPETYLDNINF